MLHSKRMGSRKLHSGVRQAQLDYERSSLERAMVPPKHAEGAHKQYAILCPRQASTSGATVVCTDQVSAPRHPLE